MSNDSKARFGDIDLWIRFLYMILFAFLSMVSRFVVCLVGLVQFVLVLFSGEDNRNLRSFGNSLSCWTYDAYRFLTFNSEQKPFPFMDWPEETSDAATGPDAKSFDVTNPSPASQPAPATAQVITNDPDENDGQEPKV